MAHNQTLSSGAAHPSSNETQLVTTNSTAQDSSAFAAFRLPLSLMACGVVLGNSLVCALFIRFRKLRTITNTFVVSLAVSDCLVAVLFVPCYLLAGHVPYVALVVPYIIGYILFAYLFNFCGVTYDRYQAIARPLFYNATMTRSTVNKILAVVWSVPLALTLIPATWEHQPLSVRALSQRVYQGFLIFLVTVFFVAICLAYSKIFRETRRQVKWMVSAIQSMPKIDSPVCGGYTGVKGSGKTKKFSINFAVEVRAAKVFAVLIITFIVCWLPLIIINIIEALGFREHVPVKLKDVSLFTLVGNSLVDPFIYSLYKTDFRRALKRWLGQSRREQEFTSNCSNSTGRDSFRPSNKSPNSARHKNHLLAAGPFKASSTETFV